MNRIGIENLLAWAYRQELPKANRGGNTILAASGWGGMARYAELLTLVDVSPNQYGCIPDFLDGGEPDPAALVVANAVAALDVCEITMPDGFDVLSDIAMLTPVERAECNARGFATEIERLQLAAIVASMARLGKAPDWRSHGEVRRSFEVGPTGRPVWRRKAVRMSSTGREIEVEIDGFDARRQRPLTGAYRRQILTPDPARLAGDRVVYQLYVMALGLLARQLSHLRTGGVADPNLPLWPWEGESARPASRIVFAELSTAARQRRTSPR